MNAGRVTRFRGKRVVFVFPTEQGYKVVIQNMDKVISKTGFKNTEEALKWADQQFETGEPE